MALTQRIIFTLKHQKNIINELAMPENLGIEPLFTIFSVVSVRYDELQHTGDRHLEYAN